MGLIAHAETAGRTLNLYICYKPFSWNGSIRRLSVDLL